MPRVRFEDGTVINFESDPSPQDIEEAYNTVKGIQPAQTHAPGPAGGQEQPSGSGWLPTPQDWMRSGQQYLGNTVHALAHPIQTVQGMGNLAMGLGQKMVPGAQAQEPYADALGAFIQQRYGSFDAARETLKRDPVGMMADASMLLSGGGGMVSKIGEVSKLGQLAKMGSLAATVGEAIDPIVATTRAARFAGAVPARILETSARDTSAQMINSLIKPKNRQFSYGRNPGLAVAQEGIVASSLDDLAQKAAASQQALGKQIGVALDLPSVASQRLNVSKALDPINTAITNAKRNPRTNAAIVQRLENLRDDLLGVVVNPDGSTTVTKDLTRLSPRQAFDFKRTIGELTKWTDNLSDDTMVNAALKKTYSSVRQSIEGVVPGIHQLNERYANLLEAATAARNQALVMQRRNPVGLFDIIAGSVGAASGGWDRAILGVLLSQGAKAAINSPYIRTELAKWVARATPAEIESFFNRVPGLQSEMMRMGVLGGTGVQRLNDNTSDPNRTGPQ